MLLTLLLCVCVGVEGSPKSVDLVLDILYAVNTCPSQIVYLNAYLCVSDQTLRIIAEGVSLFLAVHLVLAIVVGDLDEPHSATSQLLGQCWGSYCSLPSPHEDVDVFRMRLHCRHSLNRRCSRANDCNIVVLPLLCLVVTGPPSGVNDFALELILQAWDRRPLEVVQDTGTMEKEIAIIFEFAGFLARLCLSELDSPLPLLLVPVRSNDLGVESHELSKIKSVANLV